MSFVTSGGLSKLEGASPWQVDERVLGARIGGRGDNMLRIPTAHELFGREDISKETTKCYPSQSAKRFLKDFF